MVEPGYVIKMSAPQILPLAMVRDLDQNGYAYF